ncbi:HD domain-containing protein, partial [bacterium]|nr:HD domain-containing protein [bacterium]
WTLRGVRDAETVAQHTFHLAIASWILGEKKGLDSNKTMKLGLVHDLCEIYAGDQTPYDPLKKISKAILKKPARISKNKKIEWLIKKKQKEWDSLKKTTEPLPQEIAKEIKNLWVEFEERLTKEGRFVYQLDKVENVFQATHYWLKDKKFPIVPWWISIKEMIDDGLLLDLIAQLDEKFKHHLLKLNGPKK